MSNLPAEHLFKAKLMCPSPSDNSPEEFWISNQIGCQVRMPSKDYGLVFGSFHEAEINVNTLKFSFKSLVLEKKMFKGEIFDSVGSVEQITESAFSSEEVIRLIFELEEVEKLNDSFRDIWLLLNSGPKSLIKKSQDFSNILFIRLLRIPRDVGQSSHWSLHVIDMDLPTSSIEILKTDFVGVRCPLRLETDQDVTFLLKV